MNDESTQFDLFAAADLPRAPIPVPEWSQEWMDARLLRAAEGIRFDAARLHDCETKLRARLGADYSATSFRGFLDHVIQHLGGRSQ